MDDSATTRLDGLLEEFPTASYLLCAAHGEKRVAVMISHAARCANDPPMILVALDKGQSVSPVIRDARRFALAILPADDEAIARRFRPPSEINEDPFIGMPAVITPGGVTVPKRAAVWFECELSRHLDIEADCEVYIGAIRAAARLSDGNVITPGDGASSRSKSRKSVLRSSSSTKVPSKRTRSSRRA